MEERNPRTGRPYSEKCATLRATAKKLPIFAKKDEFIKLYKEGVSCIILEGPTGTGKSTQIPQYVHEANSELGRRGQIICTQPCRATAKQLASRVAEEMDAENSNIVGYQVAYKKRKQWADITFVTEGILLNEIVDSFLGNFRCIILDEAHQRRPYMDLLLGYLHDRVDDDSFFQLIIMTATADDSLFSQYFPNSSKISFDWSLFPVEIKYMDEPSDDYLRLAVQKTKELHLSDSTQGDYLIFMPGKHEIRNVIESLQVELARHPSAPVEILPFYSGLSWEQQQLIYKRRESVERRIIVATSIAEASTIPNITVVIDAGRTKQRIYNPALELKCMTTLVISKDEAKRRAGRAGRDGPGRCFRLYTQRDHDTVLPDEALPVIVRMPLDAIVLKMIWMGIDPMSFSWISRPSTLALASAYRHLHFLQVFNPKNGEPSWTGRMMAELPLDPKLSKCILAARHFECSQEIAIIAAMLASRENIFRRPRADEQAIFDEVKGRFAHRSGDHLTLMNVFDAFQYHFSGSSYCNLPPICASPASDARRRWCQQNFIIPSVIDEAIAMFFKLSDMLSAWGCRLESFGMDKEGFTRRIKGSLLVGHVNNIAKKIVKEDKVYYEVRTSTATIHALLADTALGHFPDYILYDDMLYTGGHATLYTVTAADEDLIDDVYYWLKYPAHLRVTRANIL